MARPYATRAPTATPRSAARWPSPSRSIAARIHSRWSTAHRLACQHPRVEIVLRRWTEDDAPALTRAIAESLDHLRPWMPWAADEPRDEALRRAWIREQAAGTDRVYGMWLGDRVVGGCGLHRRLGPGALEI